jgi:hypothetical protein
MSDPAAPWWTEVQHLRPREDAPSDTHPAPRTPSRRFRRAEQQPDAAIATLEHEVADVLAGVDTGWADRGRDHAPWDEPAGREDAAAWDEPAGREAAAVWDEPAGRGDVPVWDEAADTWDEPAAASPETPVWDDSLEEAIARAPSWTDDEAWLLPKGADRIENGRRTIEIRGQVGRVHGFDRTADAAPAGRGATGARRPARRPSERFERRPDRVAMWAFLLGVLLILIAMFSKPGDADAAVHAAAGQPAAQVLVVGDAPAAPARAGA